MAGLAWLLLVSLGPVLSGCHQHALQTAIVDFEAQPVEGAHVTGWYLTDEDDGGEALTNLDAADTHSLPENAESIDAWSDADGVVAVPTSGPVRVVWLQVWLPRRAWPSFRQDGPLLLDTRDSSDVLGFDLVTQTETHTVIQLTVNSDPTARAVDDKPRAHAPRNWPPASNPD